ncbi:hypothetical protein QBC40DRAFT_6024 [Triangularia verruculosa]|uniref:Uncharacterized protein n=1 Tax=Triangularia verruculosa TaxID=2587418 RepID=A0AAN7APS9_9PEZI|nr:hypothetical protein QBC40DRAFT_6024 [Triangularia verruculosa]
MFQTSKWMKRFMTPLIPLMAGRLSCRFHSLLAIATGDVLVLLSLAVLKMDPLSISASIVALIGAVTASIKCASHIKHAQDLLSSLLEDMATFEILMAELQPLVHDTRWQLLLADSRLADVISTAQGSLKEINDILKATYIQPSSEGSVRLRRSARFRPQQRLKELQYTLLMIRINITAMLSVFTA